MKPRRSLKRGDLVLIADENVHHGKWPLGKVVDVLGEKDGHVRSAKVQTSLTVLTRPVTIHASLKDRERHIELKKTNLFFLQKL